MSENNATDTKILVAEDESDIADIIHYLLTSKGYNVTLCANGEDALKKLPEIQPDLLILDVMMPKMSGFALVKEIKKDENMAEIPILMVSGISKGSNKSDEYWQKGMGVDDYISKPFDPKELVKRVENLLRKKREGWLEMERNGNLTEMILKNGSMSVKDLPKTEIKENTLPKQPSNYPTTPEDVVKTFVESWNNRAFDMEYKCLASRMAYTNQQEYIQRRLAYYNQTHESAPHKQSIQKIVSSKTSGMNAQVEIVRLDTEGNRRRLSRETYTLIQENGNWKINAVKAGQ